MRALWTLVVVVLIGATGAPRVDAASREASALRSARHDAVLVSAARPVAASVRRTHDHPPVALAVAPALVPPPRIAVAAAPAPRVPAFRPRLVACSARGPPLG